MPPPVITNTLLQGWDASTLALANGDPVEVWPDINGVHDLDTVAVPNGTTPHFQINSINDMPGVVFEGADYLGVAGATMNHITLFMVVDAPENTGAIHHMAYSPGYLLTSLWTTAGRWIFGRDEFSFMEFTDNTVPGEPAIFTFLYLGSSTTSKLRINQTQVASGPQFEGTSNVFRLGHPGGLQSGFTAYEVLVYGGEVSTTDIDTIEDYLYNKWFVPSPPDPPFVPGSTPGIQICWEPQGGGLAWDQPPITEIRRTDCNGTETIAMVADDDGCFCDMTFSLSNDGVFCSEGDHTCEIVYEVRYWGVVNGALVSSDWVALDPIVFPNPDPGQDWITDARSGLTMPICPDRVYSSARPFGVFQPIGGGLPTVVTGFPGGRNYTLTIPVHSEAELVALEEILASPIVHYRPTGAADEWLAPNQGNIEVTKVGRVRVLACDFVRVNPQPVLDPSDFFPTAI